MEAFSEVRDDHEIKFEHFEHKSSPQSLAQKMVRLARLILGEKRLGSKNTSENC